MAIAFDSVLSTQNHTGSPITSPVTDTFVNTAGDYAEFGLVFRGTAIDVTPAVTYAGASATLIRVVNGQGDGGTSWEYIFGLVAPATGSNTISVSFTGAPTALRDGAVSYSGCKQSGQADASKTGTATGVTSVTDSLTTVADNSWVTMWIFNDSANDVAGTGSTARGTANNPMFFDSNGPVHPAGSYSMSVSWAGSGGAGYVMASIAPVAAASTTIPLLALLGAGT